MEIKMKFTILECRRFQSPGKKVSQKRLVCNYEFDYYLADGKTTILDGRKSEVGAHCLCFRKPGQTVVSYGGYNCYLLTVDFSGRPPIKNYTRNTATVVEERSPDPLLEEIPDVVEIHHSEEMHYLFSLLERQVDYTSELSHMIFEEILLLVNADVKYNLLKQSQSQNEAIDALIYYIHKHYKEKITLDDMSVLVHLNKNYIVRFFKQICGITPMEYVAQYRLNKAQILLTDTDLTVGQIAEECGYPSPAFFSAQFKKRFTVTPNAYRKDFE